VASSAELEARLTGRHGCLPPQWVIITTGDAEKNREFFTEHKVNCPVLLQKDGEVAQAYRTHGTPTGYLVTAGGKIASAPAMLERIAGQTRLAGVFQPALRSVRRAGAGIGEISPWGPHP
jgi:hypothetical protein